MISMAETIKTSSAIMFMAAGSRLFMAFAGLRNGVNSGFPARFHRKGILSPQYQAVARCEWHLDGAA